MMTHRYFWRAAPAILALFAVSAGAQTCPSSSALYPSGLDGDAQLAVASNGVATYLNAALTAGATTFSPVSSAGMVANMYLSIDSEIVFLTATTPLTIARGCDGTVAAGHLNRAAVQGRINAGYHNTLRKAVESVEQNVLPGLNTGSHNWAPQFPGVSLVALGVNQSVPLSPMPAGITSACVNVCYVYLSGGTGTAEATIVTGWSSSAITVTPTNAHSGAWTVQSATSGIQETVMVAAAITTADQTGGDARPSGIGVKLFDGVSAIYAPIVLPISVNLYGSGPGGSVISMQTNGQNGIVVPSTFATYSLSLHDFQIRYQNGLTFPTAGSAIQINNTAVGTISNVNVATAYNGIELNAAGVGPSLVNVWVTATNVDVWVHGNTYAVPGGFVGTNLNLIAGGAATYGFLYQGAAAGIALSNSLIGAKFGIVIDSGAGNPLNEIHIDNVDDDPGNTAGGIALQLVGDPATASNTIQVSNSKFTAEAASSYGVAIQGANQDQILLSNNQIVGNTGLLISGGSPNLTATGNSITGVTAIVLQSSASNGKFVGNRIGYAAGNYIAGATSNISTDNTPTGMTFESNDFNPSGAMPSVANWSGTANIFASGQIGVPQPAIASGASFTMPPYPFFTVTGTTGVTSVAGCNAGASGSFVTTSGAVTFTAGTGIGNTFTSTANLPVSWFCDAGGKVWLK